MRKYVKTQTALAKELNVSPQTVCTRMKRGGSPGVTGWGYNVKAWREYFISTGLNPDDNVRRGTPPSEAEGFGGDEEKPPRKVKSSDPSGSEQVSYEEGRRRKIQAEARMKDYQLAILRGEHLSADSVKNEWASKVGRAIGLLRAKLENELPPILSGLEAHAIRKELADVVDDFCKAMQEDVE